MACSLRPERRCLNFVKVPTVGKGISKERIVAAALELLNDKGMDALTVRALATRLEILASWNQTMSLW